ncbi:MAG: carboxypeptidase-like regulatory domain-containing protein [Bacteroidia bacterium]
MFPFQKLFFAALWVSASCSLFAQNLTGKVLNATTREAIAYVNIGIQNKDIGTLSDESGRYNLSLEKMGANDTLRFSCIGYKDYVLYAAQKNKWGNTTEILMKPQEMTLEEVIIKPRNLKPIVLGNPYKKQVLQMQAGFATNDLGSEVGVVMRFNKKGTGKLEKLHFYISKNEYQSIKFRINIYSMNKGKPSNSLLHEPLYATFDQKSGEMAIDVRHLNLYFEEDVFVALEWLKDLGKEGLMFQANTGTSLIARKTSQGKWIRIPLDLCFWADAMYEAPEKNAPKKKK